MNGQFLLAQRVTSGAADTGSQFKRLSDLNVTLQTVINTLRNAGLRTAIEKKRPLPSRAHWQGALEHQHWTLEDWGRVNWSHETNINRMG